ncbi:GNAT family N-acetyltransferase [Arenimonas sp.]|uniref:GNAT family N-acetyltransferase n=1 Tax=Arenimonas sp. TaxID=1872635 RepID=UPI0039E3B84A
MMRIEPIAAHPERVAELAAWHHAQWAHLYDDWTLAVAMQELRDHASRRGIPTTLLLLEGDSLLGSVSVVTEDAPALQFIGSPWLASLYVVPEARGRGLGKELVLAAVRLAAENDVPRLLLFTPEHADFYRRLGWQAFRREDLLGTPVDVMAIEPRRLAA